MAPIGLLRAVLLAAIAILSYYACGEVNSSCVLTITLLGLATIASFRAVKIKTGSDGGDEETQEERDEVEQANEVIAATTPRRVQRSISPTGSSRTVSSGGDIVDEDDHAPRQKSSRRFVGQTVHGTPVYARGLGEVLKPTYALTDEQEKAVNELQTALRDLEPAEAAFCDRACLCRYLRARDWSVRAAERLLRETLQWREEYGIERVTVDDIRDELSTGKIYIHGFDREGRPVMYQKPRNENSRNHENQVKTVAYLLEREVCSMDLSKGVEKHALIIDFKGYSILNRPPMSVTKQVLSLLMDKYPERLGVAFLVDAPVLFQACWRVVKPFLPPETKKKIFFIARNGTAGRNGKMADKLAEYFDDDQVEEDYGGTLPSTWDWGEFIKSEKEMRPRMDAWFHSGRSVQLGAAWDPKGYKPAHKAIQARLKAANMAEIDRQITEAAAEERVASSGRLRGMMVGGVPIMSPDRGVSPTSPSLSGSSARKRLDLSGSSPRLTPRNRGDRHSLSPAHAALVAGSRCGRVPLRAGTNPGLRRASSVTSLQSGRSVVSPTPGAIVV